MMVLNRLLGFWLLKLDEWWGHELQWRTLRGDGVQEGQSEFGVTKRRCQVRVSSWIYCLELRGDDD